MIKNIRRKVYFLIKLILVFVTLTVGLLACGQTLWWSYATRPIALHYDAATQTAYESIGLYTGYDTGERAAFQHIANQMRLYPQANLYVVEYHNTLFDEIGPQKLGYNRKEKRFSRGSDEGGGSWYENVTDAMIQKVAAKHGKMDEFMKMGGSFFP